MLWILAVPPALWALNRVCQSVAYLMVAVCCPDELIDP